MKPARRIGKMKLLLSAAAAVVLAAGALVAWKLIADANNRPEYPDAPFERVGPDFPHIIPLCANISFDEAENVGRFLTDDGAVRNASPEEREAVKDVTDPVYLDSGKPNYLRGAELARAILRTNPNSVPALYALAEARHHEDANLPRALFEIRQARHILEDRGRANPRDADSREWYLRVLQEEYQILNEMDRREEQLRVVELMEQVYRPLPWLKVFPLIKLKRLDEAEANLQLVEQTGQWGNAVRNWRPMLPEARRDRDGCYQLGKDTAEKSPYNTVEWYNFGLSCLNDFRLDEAEAAFDHAAHLSEVNFDGSPWMRLAVFYLQEGRTKDAWEAFQKGRLQRGERKPDTLQQDQTFTDRSLALMMLAVGRSEDAERFARRAYELPGRTGDTTDDQRSQTTLSGLVLYMALESRIEELQEADAARTGMAALSPADKTDIANRETELWTLRRHMIDLLSDETFLNELLRPYLPGQDDKEAWVTPTIIRILPPGVAVEAIRQARQSESNPNAASYFDALEAEADLIRGQPEEAHRLALQALASLPSVQERTLRARASAIAAEAARQLGHADECRQLTGAALQDFPEVFRLLHLSIPVRIEQDGSAQAARLADALLRSPRFREDPAGLRIVLAGGGGQLHFALYGADQSVQSEGAVPLGSDLAAALQRFHALMMSPVLDLTDADVNTLAAPPKRDSAATGGVLKQPHGEPGA
ncbi:MAG TPA: hypothetical protein VMS17_03820 [Gemmataceae bacterium]|nr:hypothetical protein [Gemmataceae bacterium]